jgi:hypothetical protein
LETTYLEETKDFGNIFAGWDAYLSLEKVKPKKNITVEERLFSLSSVTSPASRKEYQKNKVYALPSILVTCKFIRFDYTILSLKD